MGRTRNDVCMGIFRSASSIEVLQTMIERVQQKVRKAGDIAEQRAETTQQTLMQAEVEQKPEPKKEIELPKIEKRIELPKIGRNDTVTIAKGSEQLTLKFKKAEPMILNEGWRLVKWDQ